MTAITAVTCDGCEIATRIDPAEARWLVDLHSREAGWSIEDDNEHLCPDCQPETP